MAFSDGPINAIERKIAGTHMLLKNLAGHMEGDAKDNIPWKPRFGHAQEGLHAGVEKSGSELILYLAHGVEYGIWLELACKKKEDRQTTWNQPGPYAIINPTIEKYLPQIKQSILDWWS
jgi:hypothetical protein